MADESTPPPQAAAKTPTLEEVVASTPTTHQGQFERIGTIQTQTTLQSSNLQPYTGVGGGYWDPNTGIRVSEATYANQVRFATAYSPEQIASLGQSALQASSALATGSSKGMTSSEVRASQPMGLYSSSGQAVGFGSAAYYSNYAGSQPVALAGYLNQTGIATAPVAQGLPAQSYNKELGVVFSTTAPQGTASDMGKSEFFTNMSLLGAPTQSRSNPMFITDTTATWNRNIAEQYGSMDTRQGKLNLVDIGVAGVSLTTAAVALKGWSDSVSESITKYRDIGYNLAPEGVTKSWVGLAAGAAQTVPFVASIPYAAVWSVTNPLQVPEKGAEIVSGMATDIGTRGLKNPTGVIGELTGMYVGGKAVGKVGAIGADVLNAASPIKAGVAPVATSTAIEGGQSGITYIGYIATQKPAILSRAAGEVRPLPQVRAYFASGEYSGAGVGPATEFLKGLPEVNSPPIMRVRPEGGIEPLTKSQQVVLDPFFREVAKGTTEEKYVNAVLTAKQVLPQTERIGSSGEYKLVGGYGAAELYKVQPEIKAAAMEKIAVAGGRYLGSTSLVDIYGKQYVRDVSMSDIDVSVPLKNMRTLKYSEGGLSDIFAQNVPKIELSKSGKPGERGYVLATGETEHVAAIGSAERFADVRTFDVTTTEGNILEYGTPEYQIETKFSRLGGGKEQTVGLRYTQEGGVEIPTSEKQLKKAASDYADIFSGAGYLSRESAIKGMPGVSRAYESIAENLKSYAEATGKAEKFSEIQKSALPEARAARQIRSNLGGVLGVELGISEYPTALKATTTIKEGKVVPVASLEYPEATSKSTQLTSTAYPETTSIASYPETLVSSSYAGSTPVVSTTGGAYPVGGVSSETYYAVAGFSPDNYNRFISYPNSLPQPEYPRGTAYPTESQYPRGQTQPYPTTYPSGKGGVGIAPASSVKITLPELLLPKPEDRLTSPPIRTRNYFKFHEILQGIDYSRVNLLTGYGGKLSTVTGKKTGYFDVKYSVKESPLGTVTAGKESIDLIQQSIQITPVRKSYKQFTEFRARGPVDIGPDFNKARFNIPKKQTYYRRKK